MSGLRWPVLLLAAALAAPSARAQQEAAAAAPPAAAASPPAAAARAEPPPAALPLPAPARAPGAPRAIAGLGPAPTSSELLLRAVGISALVLGALWFGADWLRRRARARAGPRGTIEVIAMRGLGPRHRVALIEVGGARLLVGLSHDGICTLHDLSESAAFAPALARELPELEPGRDPALANLGHFEGLDG
jgi:flagellar biogenesis protein FliO